MDHCMSAFLENTKAEVYRVYVTDALKAYLHLDRRYYDMVNIDTKSDTRTGEEIIEGIKGKLRVLGGSQNESI